MRHFFKFISTDKHDDAEHLYSKDDDHLVADAKSTVSEPGLDSKIETAKAETPVSAGNESSNWREPEADGPEFGGLIERRGTDHRGLMPPPYTKLKKAEELKERSKSESLADKALAGLKSDGNLESTGKFLSSLDNSSITLADSGLFQRAILEDDDEVDSFNPYDRT